MFEVELGPSTVAIGQVIDTSGDQLFVVTTKGEHPRGGAAGMDADRVALGAITLDAFFFHNRWVVTGNAVPLPLHLPTFVVATTPNRWVRESFHGEQLEVLSPEAAESLRPRKIVAPVRIDRATKALHGYLPWEPVYDELLISP